jgi:hypothetical protein
LPSRCVTRVVASSLSLSLSLSLSEDRGDEPHHEARLSARTRGNQANIRLVKVKLPKQLPSRLTLPKGLFSALTGLGDLCKDKLRMPTQFIAQNGMEVPQNTKIAVSGCPKQARKASHKKRRRGRGKWTRAAR